MLRSCIPCPAARASAALVFLVALAARDPLDAGAQMAPARSGGAAVTTIRPGDRAVNGDALPLGTESSRMLIVKNGVERQVGTMRKTISATTVHGTPALLVVVDVDNQNGTLLDSTTVLRHTLAPVSLRSYNKQRTMSLDFAGDRVTGSYVPTDSAAKPIDYPFSEPLFDSAIIDLVYAALPLREGYAARVPGYIYELGGMAWFDLDVTGKSIVAGHEVWQARMTMPRVTMTWLIDTHTRQVRGWTRTLPDGSEMKVVP